MTAGTDAEWRLRQELAACYRIFDHLGWTEMIYNHITLRLPGEEPRFLINPFGPFEVRMRDSALAFRLILVVRAQHDASFVHHGIVNQNRHAGTDGERNRIAWTRIDLDFSPVLAQDDARIEDIISQVGHGDAVDRAAHVVDDGADQIVGKRTRGSDALQLHGDGFRLVGANPDWKMPLAVDLLQNDDAVLRHQTDADALNDCLDHGETFRPRYAHRGRTVTAISLWPARMLEPDTSLQPRFEREPPIGDAE